MKKDKEKGNMHTARKKRILTKSILGITIMVLAACSIIFTNMLRAKADITTGKKGTVVSNRYTSYSKDCVSYPLEPGYMYITPYQSTPLKSAYKGTVDQDDKEYTYGQQYIVFRQSCAFQIPKQTEDSIVFVSAAILEEYPRLQDGWLYNISKVYYGGELYNVEDTKNVVYGNQYLLDTNQQGCADKYKEICNSGIFYPLLSEAIITSGEQKGSVDYDKLNQLISEKNIKTLMSADKVKKAKQIWSYITNFDVEQVSSSANKYTAQANTYITQFVTCNDTIKYASGDPKKLTLEEVIESNKYNLHYLDLLLCAYACGYDSTNLKNQWLTACQDYINSLKTGDTYGVTAKSNIALGAGMIAVGENEDDKGKVSQVCVYAGCEDLVDFMYQLKHSSVGTKDKEINKYSVTKGFTGYAYKNVESGKLVNGLNKEVQSTLPNYYYNYYDRLEQAIKYNKKSSDSLGGLTDSQSWHSRNILQRILRFIYTASGKKENSTNPLSFIEEIHQKSITSQDWGTYYGVKDLYGAFFVPAYQFRAKELPKVNFSAYLDVLSEDSGAEDYSSAKNSKDDISISVYEGEDESVLDKVHLRLRIKSPDKELANWKKVLDEVKSGKAKITVNFYHTDDTDAFQSTFDTRPFFDKTRTKEKVLDYLNPNGTTPLVEEMDQKFCEEGLDISDRGPHSIGYYAQVTITYKVNGVEYPVVATTNEVRITYQSDDLPPNPTVPPSAVYYSEPRNYAELKEGTIYNETFEAMAGVPSTRSLYFSTGGSEFIVNLRAEYSKEQTATRTYSSHFNGTECEYKQNDQLKSLVAGQTSSNSFVADRNGSTYSNALQVVDEDNKAVVPDGASSMNTTVNAHNTNTVFEATWRGTITNQANMSATGYQAPSQSACNPNPGSAGTITGTRTSWNTTEYDTALAKAIQWAGAMEGTNSTYTVMKIADSDGQKRMYCVGDAVIKVTLNYSQASSISQGRTNAPGSFSYTAASYSGGTYSLSNSSSAGNIGSNLGDGYCTYTGSVGIYTPATIVAGNKVYDVEPDEDGNNGIPHVHALVSCPYCSGQYCSSCGSHDIGVMIDDKAQCTKTPDIGFTIEVTFKNGTLKAANYDGSAGEVTSTTVSGLNELPTHALCGPCCQHNLPAIEDTWSQSITFDTIKITNVRVWKLDSGYAEGMTEIQKGSDYEEDDYDVVISEITQSDPNIFYNIAAANTSEAGRIRYTLQTGQDDAVKYIEMADSQEKRSNKCDGQATVVSIKNPVQDGGQGHKQSWSKGCLYTNNSYTNQVDYHKNLVSDKKQSYSNDTIDGVDMETLEWKRFNERRNQPVTATVISDFLILQTSSGDQSIVYYEDDVTSTAQKDFDPLTFDDVGVGWSKMWIKNNLVRKSIEINIGSYNGKYDSPLTKYKGSGNNEQIDTAFDEDEESFGAIEDELGLAKVTAAREISNSSDHNKSSPGESQTRLDRVSGLIITKEGITQCPINTNKLYETGQSYAFYKPILSYDTTEAVQSNKIEYKVESSYNEIIGMEGYTQESAYTSGLFKVNDIVVQDPVSAQDAMIVAQNGQLDQRVLSEDLSSAALNKELGKEGSCPGTPGECEYRLLNCKYLQIMVKAAFDMDTYSMSGGEEEENSSFSYYLQNSVKNANGSYAFIGLDDTGFALYEDSYSNYMIHGTGKATLPINWESIGVDSTNTAENIQIEGEFIINDILVPATLAVPAAPLICTDYIRVGASREGYIYVETAEGSVYRSNNSVVSETHKFNLTVQLCFGTLSEFAIQVNSNTIAMSKITTGTSTGDGNVAGPTLYIGNREDNVTTIDMFVDNLKITRLPGTVNHTDSCYTTVNYHEKNVQDLYNGLVTGSNTIDWTGIKNSGLAKIFSTNNVHTHTQSCLTKESIGYQLALEHGKNGDWSDLKKELGSTLWNMVAQRFNLNEDQIVTQNVVEGQVLTYNYTGGIQSVTLPAGVYQLQAWGAQGGNDRGIGGKGGYAAGTLNLTQRTTLYLQAGGKGVDSATNSGGGYNGGGNTGAVGSSGGGGGATSIATASGTLAQLVSYQSSVLLVAGGGGGAGGYIPTTTMKTKTGNNYYSGSTEVKAYEFTATAGGTVSFYSTSYTRDPVGNIYVNGVRVARDDDSGSDLNFYCSATISEGDVVTCKIVAYAETGSGSADWVVTYPESTGSDVDGNGATGGGTTGGSTPYAIGGTQSSGYAFGQGGPCTVADGSGGGGGYFGGYGANADRGAGGGSGFVSARLTDASMANGANDNNGTIKITVIKTVDYDKIIDFIIENQNLIPDKVTTAGYTITNPIWNCKCKHDRHVCTSECVNERILTCNEPHHYGLHYDYGNEICYDACYNDENHKLLQDEAVDSSGKAISLGNMITLDHEFQVYFPNRGDFYETNALGILSTQRERGQGYTNSMDTTEWTREKWVNFPFSVLYCRNGTWEQYDTGERISLEIYDASGTPIEYYDFYCQLKNEEVSQEIVQYVVEAINLEESPGGAENPYEKDDEVEYDCEDTNEYVNNKNRFSDLTAYHSAYKYHYIDVVGRIGNLIMEDSQDLRYSNLFKLGIGEGSLIDGILKEVEGSIPVGYLSWHRNSGGLATDIRGEQVSQDNEYYNTYGTQKWSMSARSQSLPLSANKNSVDALKTDELKLGYNVLWDISTIGNYDAGTIQVCPYYYALNTNTGVLTPVDVYIGSGEKAEPINYFGLLANGTDTVEYATLYPKLYSYVMNLDWTEESARRNYTEEERYVTETTGQRLQTLVYDSDGEPIVQKIYNENTGTYEDYYVKRQIDLPNGNYFTLGNSQLLYAQGRARTFIGTSQVTAVNINGSHETELNDSDPLLYYMKGQRWHLTLGLPSSSIFVAYRNGERITPNQLITTSEGNNIYARDEFTSGEYVILMTADIRILGSVYDLQYSQKEDNGTIVVNGKTFHFGNEIPTVLAVYDNASSSSVDYDIMQTH